jgi:ribosomal protein L11 methyltransferase
VTWLEIEVTVKTEDADVVGVILHELTGYGVAFEEKFYGGADCPASLSVGTTKLKGYLPAAAAKKIKKISAALAPYLLAQPQVRELPKQDWLQSYRDNYKHFRVGKRLVVKPPWEECKPAPGDLVLTIDPGLAFGCGTHPTTQLCLELLEEVVGPGAVVYDVGTGSGILAIASALLGAAKVVAVDIDEIAVRVARGNVALNSLEATVDVVEGNLLEGLTEPADVIVANLTADAVIGFAGEAARCLRPGGIFIAGGIPAARATEVSNELQKLFTVRKTRRCADWAGFMVVLNE